MLFQDLTQDGALFVAEEWRASAHGAGYVGPGRRRRGDFELEAAKYSILDELEGMRRLDDGELELKLTWPGSLRWAPMTWSQDVNPVLWNAGDQRKAELWNGISYTCEPEQCPYESEGEGWGGLEYSGGAYALLDGEIDNGGDGYHFQVGSVEWNSHSRWGWRQCGEEALGL